jgi:hypothetical protein
MLRRPEGFDRTACWKTVWLFGTRVLSIFGNGMERSKGEITWWGKKEVYITTIIAFVAGDFVWSFSKSALNGRVGM